MYKNRMLAISMASMLGWTGHTHGADISTSTESAGTVSAETQQVAEQELAALGRNAQDPAVLGTVTVTALPFDEGEEGIAQPVDVLDKEELRRKREASIGDTLSGELGVSSSYFGPGAGRPIIRGLDGPRIRVLEGGIGTLDLSSISPDHQVTVESLNAQQIEILRGPSALLYGSGASGGVVNVVTDRIPRSLPANGFKGDVELRTNSVSDEFTGGANLTAGTGNFAFHLDGFMRETNDYEIPGRAVRGDPDSRRGVLENSSIESEGISAGASLMGERGFVGVSVSGLNSNYGLPTEEQARIDLEQTRYDLDSELDEPFAGFERLSFRLGYNDYLHQEIESTGEVATTFINKATEGRVELLHNPIADWQGALGMQFITRDFAAIGEEALVPQTDSDSIGIFLVEHRDWDRWHIELGARAERSTQSPSGDNPDRDFNAYSGSAGTVWKFVEGYSLGSSFTYAERAPSTEELYSNGPHPGTLSFDIGDADLNKEISHNLDISLRKTTGRVRGTFNVFANRIDDYILGQSVDIDADGVADFVNDEGILDPDGELQLLNFGNVDADFYGAEAELVVGVLDRGADTLDVRVFVDSVRGKLRDGGDLPRITPLRLGVGADYGRGPWQIGMSLTHITEQNKVADLETETNGYTLLEADLGYTLKAGKSNTTLFLQGRNLLDEEARVHTSFLKDVAPLPGRAIVVGVRTHF
ncbi:MAG: TonB-dependent receptor [Gammaproteobacteria bacterium]